MILKNEKDFENLKNMLKVDACNRQLEIEGEPTQYPCLVKIISEEMIDSNILDEEEAKEMGLEFDDGDNDGESIIVSTQELAFFRLIFISKQEIQELLNN